MSELPAVKKVIPHRSPFLFLTHVSECSEQTATGHHTFADEAFFEGHFPTMPIVPGVILIEGLAQTLAYLALRQVPDGNVMLTGVDKCKVRASVHPGDEVTYQVTVERAKLRMVIARGSVTVEGKMVLTAVLKGYITKPNAEIEPAS